jgi:NADH dehydrogenase FAD-containing subunit
VRDRSVLYKNAAAVRPSITLIQSDGRLLNSYHPSVSETAVDTLRAAGVNVLLNHRVKEVSASSVTVLDKAQGLTSSLPSGLTIWATGVGPRSLVGLPLPLTDHQMI